ncbi:MAG: response regulator [Planctomycetaceae bacterium]|nr:response regulator [Planctomycetaceae bacterium]
MARGILQSGDLGAQHAVARCIMVVDDDADSARETKTRLENAGFEAKVFKDGGQVHGSLSMDRPDLVLLKLILPGESGFEICERLKKQDRFLPVVVYSEIELEAAQNLAAKLGADGYILKPCQPETLVATIREVADLVWERQADEREGKEKGEIRFRCKCGHRMKEKLENRGKLVTCSQCQSLVQIPERGVHDMIIKLSDAANANTLDDPMRFLSVKCQHCGTYYKLFSNDLEKARTCPKCQKRQIGALSIIGAPLSRAALASSLRVLRILSGQLKGKKLMLPDQEITLGSSRTCQLKQYGEGIAPQHCTLKPTPMGILVNDLNSETGTFIDNERITGETLLEPGGLLKVGSMLFRLVGQNRDVNSTTFYDPKQAKAQRKADRKGVKLFLSDKPTAEEAADVIQAHWDIVRRKSTMPTDPADA